MTKNGHQNTLLSSRTKGVLFTILLALAVAAAMTLLARSIASAIPQQAKTLLGGDVEISQSGAAIPDQARYYMMLNAQDVSSVSETRTMAAAGQKQTLVDFKGVDRAYPLYGTLSFQPAKAKRKRVFGKRAKKDLYGAAVDQRLLDELGIGLGGTFEIGNITLIANAILAEEPDRNADPSSANARVMVSAATFRAAQSGREDISTTRRYRAKLGETTDIDQWKMRLSELFPDVRWSVRDWREHAQTAYARLPLLYAACGLAAAALSFCLFALARASFFKQSAALR